VTTETVTRRLAAIAAADVVGYSRLMEGDEAGTLARLKSARAETIDPAVAAHGGRIVKTTGDGMLVEFSSAVAAAKWALGVQAALDAREPERPEGERIALRIGINLGDVILDGDDIYGDGVNIAARLEALAPPGGIAVSAAVQEQIHGKVGADFVDAGAHRVKNIARPLGVWCWPVAPERVAPATTDSGAEQPSIAVLPFDYLGSEADRAWLADGITEEIITGLARLPGLLVIARNSSFTYKGRPVTVSEVARELGVRYILEGSVREAAERVRIAAQLIDGASGRQLWAETFEGDPADVFDLQDEITRRIVNTIHPEIIQAESTRLHVAPARTLAAWECIIRAVTHFWRWTKADFAEGERLAREAIGLEPDNAEALAMLALIRWGQAISGFVRPGAPAMTEALDVAKRAVAADNRASHARIALGAALLGVGRGEEAKIEVDRAVEVDPNSALVMLFGGQVNAYAGSPIEAIEQCRASLRLNPRDPMAYARFQNMAVAYFALEDYGQALDYTRRVTHMLPEWSEARTFEIASLAMLDRDDEASEAAAAACAANPHLDLAYVARRHPYRDEAVRTRLIDALRRAGIPEHAGEAAD